MKAKVEESFNANILMEDGSSPPLSSPTLVLGTLRFRLNRWSLFPYFVTVKPTRGDVG